MRRRALLQCAAVSRSAKSDPDDDPTQSAGKPLPRDEATADPTSPTGSPLDPTVNVEPDAAMVNDPRRVVLPPTTREDDPTRNVLPQVPVHQLVPAPLPGTDPTVNVTPD